MDKISGVFLYRSLIVDNTAKRSDSLVMIFHRLRLRQSTDRDISRVCLFYFQNRPSFLAVRSAGVLEEAVRERRCFVIEREADGCLLASSLVLSHMGGRYREAAGACITPSLGGLGLQQIMHRVRSVHEYSTEAFDAYFAAINSQNVKSIANTLDVGFHDWPEAPSQVRNEAVGRCGIGTRMLVLPAHIAVNHARWLLGTEHGIELSRVNRLTSEQEFFNIKIAIEALLNYRIEITKLS